MTQQEWNCEVKAVYRDAGGNSFSALVIRTANGWRLHTEFGERDIDHFIPDATAVGGMLQFEDYAIRPLEKLRLADVIPFINSVRATLPWPVRPTTVPTPAPEPQDTRIHVEPLAPGQNSLRVLQNAGGPAYGKLLAQRDRVRRQAQIYEPSPRTQQLRDTARLFRNQYAAKKTQGD